MAGLSEKQKVYVRHSNCGYQGPAETLGPVYGSAWLVRKLEGDEAIILVKAEFLEPLEAVEDSELSKEEKKELKKKYKAERKNHQPANGGRGGRRG